MKIVKFNEARNMPNIKSLSRKNVIDGLIDMLSDQEFFGYECVGTTFETRNEILYLHLSKKVGDEYTDNDKVLKLDLSDIGIEIGIMPFNDETEEFDEFIPELNLDTKLTKPIRDYKGNIKKFNI